MLKAFEVISFILHPPVVSCVRECCICKVCANDPRRTGKRINKIKAPETFSPNARFVILFFYLERNFKNIKYFGTKRHNCIRGWSIFFCLHFIINPRIDLNILTCRLIFKFVVSGCVWYSDWFRDSAGEINADNLSLPTGTNWAKGWPEPTQNSHCCLLSEGK